MDRRPVGAVAGLLAYLAAACPVPAQNYDDVEIKATHVAGTVHMLEGRGGNIGVSAGEDGILLIDDQFAPLADKIRAAVKAINPGDIKFVVNTHWHGDHTGGNPEFGPESLIVAHDNVRMRLTTEQTLFGNPNPPLPPEGWPVVTFAHGLSIHFNGEEIEVIHYPNSHTDGDAVVFFRKSNVVHMGDLFFSGMFPFVDLEHGGDVEKLTGNIARILDKLPPDAKIIPGHGPLSSVEDLTAYHAMLEETTAFLRKRVMGNLPLEEAQKGGLPEKFKDWGNGFISSDRWIATIYGSLSKKNN
jgi:glyoxylase-like metal-dependent hydrolase (beta-lactamase superfamily II)